MPQEKEKEEDLIIPSALEDSTLLQANIQIKRARGSTLDYKAIYEGKQNQLKRTK